MGDDLRVVHGHVMGSTSRSEQADQYDGAATKVRTEGTDRRRGHMAQGIVVA
jgi:hypothetical protein